MQKIILFFLATLFAASCAKQVKQPLSYTVTNDMKDSVMGNVYIPDTGNYAMKVRVKFMSGYQGDNVKLVITGMPANISVTPDTFVSTPTYDKDFVFRSMGATAGSVYPVTITAYTETVIPKSYNFNIIVIPADCASLFWGNLTGYSTCTTRTFAHPSTGISTGTLNTLVMNNFGGYGTNCNVDVALHCINNTVTIPKAYYGNGVILSGSGTFTADSMIIDYFAESVPTGGSENCRVIYKR